MCSERESFVERQRQRGLDAGDRGGGRLQVARLPAEPLARGVEDLGLPARCLDAVGAGAGARQRADRGDAPGMSDGLAPQVALHDGVEDTEAERLLGRHMPRGKDEVERDLGAAEPGQALRPAARGNDAEVVLGQADLRRRRADAVVAGQRVLQPAAQRIARDRGNHGLPAGLDDGGAGLGAHRPRGAELPDVRTGDEVAPAPISTIATTAGSPLARSTPSTMPSRTPGPSALTGGLSTASTATPSCTS